MALIDSLIREGWLKTPKIIDAFRKIKRVDFLPQELRDLAELNEALPIGYGQTISQPIVVAFMLEQLQPQPGEKILDVGSGSGWTSALLAYIVSGEGLNEKLKTKNVKPKGKVISIDRVAELVEFGMGNVSKYNFIEKRIAEFICSDGSKGYPDISSRPELAEGFDKILASASAEKIPNVWKEQLKIGGRIVTPVGTSIWRFIKKSATEFEEIEYPGFVFVPLIETR